MKRTLVLFGALLAALAAVNAVIDSKRQCGCEPECWCHKPGLRHFRWVVPIGHKDVSPDRTRQMGSELAGPPLH